MPSFTTLRTLLLITFLPALISAAPLPKLDLLIPSEFCTTKSGSAHPASSTPAPHHPYDSPVNRDFDRRAGGLEGGLIPGGGLGPVSDILNGLSIVGNGGNSNGGGNSGPGYPQPPPPPAGGGYPPSPIHRPAEPIPPQLPAPFANLKANILPSASQSATTPSIPGGDGAGTSVGGGDARGLLDGVNTLPLGDVIGVILGGGKAGDGQADGGKAKRMVVTQ